MSGKLRLGKTRDSRTRRKAKVRDAEAASALRQELKVQAAGGGFTDYLLARGFSAATVRRFVKDSGYFLAWAERENVPVENAGYADVLHFIQGLRVRVKQKTVSIVLNSLRHYFGYLVAGGYMAENPAGGIQLRGIKRKVLYDVLSRSELDGLYHHFEIADESSSPARHQHWFKGSVLASKRNRVMVGLLVYQGLTVYELGALREQDVQLREGQVFVPGSRKRASRTLQLEAHQILDLLEYALQVRVELLRYRGKEDVDSRFFVSTGSGDHFNNMMQKLLKKLHGQYGKVRSARQLRASVITYWLKRYNLREVQYMAGHRYVSSTEAYLINDLEDLLEDVSRFHPIG